jgi:CelD/BcsL family acetyltransferase involved in cellulose biosynthesis
MFAVQVVTTLEELSTLAKRWNDLLRETAADNIFLTWEWLYTWARHYLGSNRLWVVLVSKGDQLVGIGPLYIRDQMDGLVKVREMRFLGTEEVCSTYLDFIVPEKHKKAALHRIYRHLHEEAAGLWDVLTLAEISAESSSIDFWDGFIQEAGRVMEIAGTTVCPVIDLPSRREDFLASLSGNDRYNLHRKRKRLEQAGQVAYERATSIEEIEKSLASFIQLHQMRWNQKGMGGSFRSQRFLTFHREIARVFAKKGCVHLDFLLLNGQPIAGIYGYGYNDRYSFYLPGFNPTLVPEASPGILLLFHRIEEAIRLGYREFDLLRGVADYKMAWANGLRRSLTLRYYNNHLRAAAVKLLESGKAVVKVLVR